MKRPIAIIDLLAFILFGGVLAIAGLVMFIALSGCGRKRYRGGEVRKLSFVIYDLIANKYPGMFEDALLNGYIKREHCVYIDYENRRDRFEDIDGKILFHSIAAHPNAGVYKAGFAKVNMLIVELKALATAAKILLTDKINFVKAHDPHLLGLNALIVSRLFRLPSVLHINSNYDMKYLGTGKTSSPLFVSRSLERIFETLMMNSYDAIMADRQFYAKSRNFPKRSLGKYKAVGVRVDRPHYSSPESRRDLKEEMGLGASRVLLYVGRLHPVKYAQDAIETFEMINREVPNSALLIAGDGVLRGELEELVEERRLKGKVLFLGRKRHEELIDIFYTADILLAPHGGVTLVEAALAATPVVAYDFDWHAEFLEDGKMGFIVPFRDIRQMASRAVELLKDDRLREAMGERCRDVAMKGCSRDESIRNEIGLYRKVLR